jgi:hypothetical protein
MTKQERIALFQRAKKEIATLEKRYPGYPPFESIQNQLQFLIDQCDVNTPDFVALAQINLGYLAMREVESRNDAIADLLYEVSAEVKAMQAGR